MSETKFKLFQNALNNLRTSNNYYKILLAVIFLIGFFVRFYHLGSLPTGINQDEAYAGYEAYSLLNYGMDSHGYANPVYFVSWGSGMNVLYSYLTIPFLLLTGNHLTAFAIRLPQAFFACLSIVAFYYLLKTLYAEKGKILLGTFLFAIMPWHIMLAHWGLESNLAPAFLLFGLLFFIKASENSKYYMLSALFYGLSLYAYAPLWLAVPVILLLQFSYCFYCKKFKWDRFFAIALVLLFLIAVPLMLFLLINYGFLPEIRTGFFSVPKLLAYRGGEISIHNIKTSLYSFYTLFTAQDDGLIWNSTSEFGIYYKFSLIFVVLGLYSIGKTAVLKIKSRSWHPFTFVFINILVSVLFGLLISNINVNKINMIHVSLILCCIQGIVTASGFFRKSIYPYAIFAYAMSFIAFLSFYFYQYNNYIQEPFQYGVTEAVQATSEKSGSTIYVQPDIFYSTVLFASELPVTEYLKTVVYDPNLPEDFTPLSFDRFVFGYDVNELDEDCIYIINNDKINIFTENGFTIETYGNYSVASYVNQ
ncbi:ArnT family glycosyltransferase [Konateibacter massiliensis]|uniref:ArnT family glycosyltransferase n=1 Tax=Konateibacter massiliensis TaxID=2002841 RepID=UPI000C156E5E|nr:hypothetical protein [Konateibacter massiliensis]